MALLLTSGPSSEPVSLDEAKAHVRIDHSDEDVMIASLITAARIHLEKLLGLVFITQHWNLVLDQWPAGRVLALPLAPIQSVSAISLYSDQDEASLVDPVLYSLDAISEPARLVWHGTLAAPGRAFNGIEISLTLGYGASASSVPQPLRQAILLLVAHWYEHRELLDVQNGVRQIPEMVAMLTNAYRRVRL